MKFLSAVISALLAVSLGTSSRASTLVDRKDGDGNGSGIPTVADNKDPVCKPWYAIRDAIMGDIYHGMLTVKLENFTTTTLNCPFQYR